MLESHGFAEDTAILLCDKKSTAYLYDLCMCIHKKENLWCIASYDAQQDAYTHGTVVKSGRAVTPLTIQFKYYDDQLNIYSSVTCTPLQEFYLYDTSTWITAHRLQPGDRLFSVHGYCVVDSVENCIGKQSVYLIEIKDTHTFFVGRSGLLTHNMGLPCALNVGLSIPFGIVAGSSAGSFFGPVTMIAGAVIGSAVGITAQLVCGNRLTEYNVGTPSEEWQDYLHIQDTQTPGNKNSQQSNNINGPSNNKQPRKNNNNKKIADAVKGAKAVADKIADDARNKPQARNWNEYFENHEIGQKYKDYFEHTRISNPKDGAPIRRIKQDIPETEMFKKGHYLSPDRAHKGDHFEVWNKKGDWIGVTNLDGSQNLQKTLAEINPAKRSIKGII